MEEQEVLRETQEVVGQRVVAAEVPLVWQVLSEQAQMEVRGSGASGPWVVRAVVAQEVQRRA